MLGYGNALVSQTTADFTCNPATLPGGFLRKNDTLTADAAGPSKHQPGEIQWLDEHNEAADHRRRSQIPSREIVC